MVKVENNIIEPLIVSQSVKIISKHSEKHINKTISSTRGVEYLKLLGRSNMAGVARNGFLSLFIYFLIGRVSLTNNAIPLFTAKTNAIK